MYKLPSPPLKIYWNIILEDCNIPLSPTPLRCGWDWDLNGYIGRCNKNIEGSSLYCKLSSGWCFETLEKAADDQSNSEPRNDRFDWSPTSCKGINE